MESQSAMADDFTDRYEAILYESYTKDEITEIQQLMASWDKATYPTLPTSIIKHGFDPDYLRYLRKAANFNKKGAHKKYLLDGAIRWNKGDEFLIERNGQIVTYGEND
jgi:glutathione peroxidase-family protein